MAHGLLKAEIRAREFRRKLGIVASGTRPTRSAGRLPQQAIQLPEVAGAHLGVAVLERGRFHLGDSFAATTAVCEHPVQHRQRREHEVAFQDLIPAARFGAGIGRVLQQRRVGARVSPQLTALRNFRRASY